MIFPYMLILHFIADFLLQSREMGKKKSEEITWLMRHLAIQFGVFFVGLVPVMTYANRYGGPAEVSWSWPFCFTLALFASFTIATLNAIAHGVIDWNIWTSYKLYAHMRIVKQIKEESLWNINNKPEIYKDSPATVEAYENSRYSVLTQNWKYWEDHWFYTTIGCDQLLHTLILYFLWGMVQ